MIGRLSAAALGVAVLGTSVAIAAVPAPPSHLGFTILKEGQPIGRETYDFSRDGDATTVRVHTESRVRVLFLDFHYSHQRAETWRGDHLTRLVADTDDDGSVHHIEATEAADGPHVTVDGKVESLPAGALPLSLWDRRIVEHNPLYSIVDAEPYRVSLRDLGSETLTIDGRALPARHYRLGGDVDRDLWYGEDGLLLQVDFQRRGYPIRIVRDEGAKTVSVP